MRHCGTLTLAFVLALASLATSSQAQAGNHPSTKELFDGLFENLCSNQNFEPWYCANPGRIWSLDWEDRLQALESYCTGNGQGPLCQQFEQSPHPEPALEELFFSHCSNQSFEPRYCANDGGTWLEARKVRFRALEDYCTGHGQDSICQQFGQSLPTELALEELFNSHCLNENHRPEYCSTIGPWSEPWGLRWLVLESNCNAHPKEPDCVEFETNVIPNLEPPVIAYDHKSARWERKYDLYDPNPISRFEKDINGVPTVRLKKSEELVVVVEHTNPLLFSLEPGVAKEEDIPELAAFKQWASAIGQAVGAFVNTGLLTFKEDTEPLEHAIDPLDLQNWVDQLKNRLEDLQEAARKVECNLTKVEEQSARAVNFIQALEFNKAAEYPESPTQTTCDDPPANPVTRPTLAEMNAHFESLRQAYSDALASKSDCLGLLTSFLQVLKMDPEKPNQLPDRVREYRTQASLAQCAEFSGLKGTLEAVVLYLQQFQKPEDLREPLNQVKGELLAPMEALATVLATEEKILEDTEKLLEGRSEAGRALASLLVFEQQLKKHHFGPPVTCSNGECFKTEFVDRYLYVRREPKPVKWSKIQTHGFTIKVDSPFGEQVLPVRRADVTTEYKLTSTTGSVLGVGTALTYTPLSSPVYSAVTNPDAPESEPNQLVIAQTGEDSRAGVLALLANYAFVKHKFPSWPKPLHNLGIEGGAALSSDPGFFVGLSYQAGRYVRIGAGGTLQQVKELNGQSIGDVVAKTEDIKTKDWRGSAFYFSLTLSLESLSFFGGGE